ncbi:hypothetical protein IL306_014495 [Fusarium sp. DS 682]|nr:hypothetical protein IL306_014495 [Fusarium sp. DS 682]
MNKLPIRLNSICARLLLFEADHNSFHQREKDRSHFTTALDESTTIQHNDSGASGTSKVNLTISGSLEHCIWPFLHRLTLSPGSEQSGFGCKRLGSPGAGKQSGEKKQKPGQGNHGNNPGKDKKGIKGNGQGPGRKKRGFGPEKPNGRRLACLFYKYDPGEYECCAGYNLTKWDHVLQHLKRIHLLEEEHCSECRTEFYGEDAETNKDQHIREATCQKRTAIETGLLIEAEYNDLTGLGQGSHEEKWFRAWDKLFRGYQPPDTPFLETPESLLEARCNMLQVELPGLLQSFVRDTSSDSDRISNMTNAILRLIRNPTSESRSLGQEENLNEPSPLSSRLLLSGDDINARQDLEPSQPIQHTSEPLWPIVDDMNQDLPDFFDPTTVLIYPTLNQTGLDELNQQSLGIPLLGQSGRMGTAFYNVDQDPDSYINFSGEAELFKNPNGNGTS